MTGGAPCKCGWFNRVELTGRSEPDGVGGRYWECSEGQRCGFCSEPLLWLHHPPLEYLVYSTVERSLDSTAAEPIGCVVPCFS